MAGARDMPRHEPRRKDEECAGGKMQQRDRCHHLPYPVIPAKAGIQGPEASALALDPRFRGGDGKLLAWPSRIVGISSGADVETEAAHDAVPNQRRGEVTKAHAEDQRPGEIDPRAAVVDAALDPAGGALAAGKERGRTVPAIGHRR